MFIEKIIIFLGIGFVILLPGSILVYLTSIVWKKLKRNPASATQISLGMLGLMLLVLALGVVTILVVFQLFNQRF